MIFLFLEKFKLLKMGDYRLDDTCVEHSYKTLNELLDAITNIDQQKIMSFAFEDGWSEVKVQKFILKIGTYHSKLKEELFSLKEFSKDFNKKWATDNNQCFSTVENLFSKIQETLKESMRVFLTFSNKMKIRMHGKQMQLPAYKVSVLTSMYYQRFIPFVETNIVTPIVSDLCEATLDFFVDVRAVLVLCRKVIRQEARIRKDPSKLSAIYDECYEQVLKSSKVTIESFNKLDAFQVTDQKVIELNETKDISAFLAKCFHTQTESEFNDFVIQDNVYKARKEKLHPLEDKLWKKDWEIINRVRLGIQHFDEMEPKGSIDNKDKRYRLKGEAVAMLMKWSGITNEDKRKGQFMKYFKDTYKGKYKPIGDNAVYNAFDGWKEREYKIFEEKLNGIVESYKQKDEVVA